ncbi:MAG TPA: hypothetical protein VK774_08090 [Solirubrobacteraceae bacterium]|nr:hypothetical protein [Solirubrobacteraceae bacterium]
MRTHEQQGRLIGLCSAEGSRLRGVLLDMGTTADRLRLESQTVTRVLIVARLTASSAELADAVFRRAADSCAFTLLVPAESHGLHRVVDPEDHGVEEARRRLDYALPLLSRAAGSPVGGMVGSHDPLAAVQDALNLHGFHEILLCTLPVHVSRWLHIDLPRKVAALGVPVTTVVAPKRETQQHFAA